MKGRITEIVVSAVAIAIALAHMFFDEKLLRIDSTTLVLLVFAAAPWLFPFVKSLTLPGGAVVEFREELAKLKVEFREKQEAVEKKVDVIEDRGLLPGRPEPRQIASPRSLSFDAVAKDQWYTDPNRGNFGGKPQANGRLLEAKIQPAAGPSSAACNVWLCVRSIDPARPLQGKVTFYLHPTFGSRKQYDVPVVEGVAEDKITSWGVFTVGAAADDGDTKLEINLADVTGGTDKFYSQ
jgi:hypothetical protein